MAAEEENEADAPEHVWRFGFVVVTHGETEDDALQSALLYLAEYASKGELEPVDVKRLE